MSDQKTYRIFLPEGDLSKFEGKEGLPFEETIIDEGTLEQFQAKVVISRRPAEGYDKLLLQGRGNFLPGDWFVKILEREDDEVEEVTVFESMRLGDRRGYMLRSMMAEGEKSDQKDDIMNKDFEERLKRRQDLVAELLKKK
jgi:hypothetical protein